MLGSPGPIKGLFGSFFCLFPIFTLLLTLYKIFKSALVLSGSVLSASVYYFSLLLQSFLHLRSGSVFPSSLIFFCKMLAAILLEMHANVYFFFFRIFKFIYFCHDLRHAILGKYANILFLIYGCISMISQPF